MEKEETKLKALTETKFKLSFRAITVFVHKSNIINFKTREGFVRNVPLD